MNAIKRLWRDHRMLSTSIIIFFLAAILIVANLILGSLEPISLALGIVAGSFNLAGLLQVKREWDREDNK